MMTILTVHISGAQILVHSVRLSDNGLMFAGSILCDGSEDIMICQKQTLKVHTLI